MNRSKKNERQAEKALQLEQRSARGATTFASEAPAPTDGARRPSVRSPKRSYSATSPTEQVRSRLGKNARRLPASALKQLTFLPSLAYYNKPEISLVVNKRKLSLFSYRSIRFKVELKRISFLVTV